MPREPERIMYYRSLPRRKKLKLSGKKVYRLLAGKDPNKDQSYFLCQLTQAQLSKALFPLANY